MTKVWVVKYLDEKGIKCSPREIFRTEQEAKRFADRHKYKDSKLEVCPAEIKLLSTTEKG